MDSSVVCKGCGCSNAGGWDGGDSCDDEIITIKLDYIKKVQNTAVLLTVMVEIEFELSLIIKNQEPVKLTLTQTQNKRV